MENRGQKRTEVVENLPADKRACSSLDFRASSSSSSVQTHLNSPNSTPETHDNDMDTSSSASSRSEGEPEKDLTYGSCDSDDTDPKMGSLRDYQRRRSSSDHCKLKTIVSSLSQETEPSGQLAALTELCEVLSFCTENSLSSFMSDSLSPILVKLAKHESNPDMMLLAVRAITYLCDVFPRSSSFLVRHDAVVVLCHRLLAIEYLDVAEQCLQALEKISRDQPLACLQAGAIMAVLNYIDFFSTSVQRVALSTVVNICKKLPSECPSPFMEAVPILCNLLQYEDRQLVESVAISLIKIVERVSQSHDMLDELCKHGLINQVTNLIKLNSRSTLPQPVYNGLIEALVRLSAGSVIAFRSLHELNISFILKDILCMNDLVHGLTSPNVADGHSNQMHEVLKLLNELVPSSVGNAGIQQELEKKSFLVNHPQLLQKFGMDLLPILIEVVNSGASIHVCYGCLLVISKLVHWSKSDMLVELFKSVNLPSFLAGVFTRKEHHVLLIALQIAEMTLQKLADAFLNSFIKEGVFFAIDALLTPENCSRLTSPAVSGIQLSFDLTQKSSLKEAKRCLCYAFDTGRSPSPSSSDAGSCKLEKDSVHNLAKHIRTSYITPELFDFEKGLTHILLKLRAFSANLSDLMSLETNNDASASQEESYNSLLFEIMTELTGEEPVSTFEFIESGIVKSLVNYLSDGWYMKSKMELQGEYKDLYAVRKRFEVFARLFMSSSDHARHFNLTVLIQKLQCALSSVENFPVILSHTSKQKNSFATIPNGRCMPYLCLRVRFVRCEGETCLCEFSEDIFTVDPLASLDAIERFLWPKVRPKGNQDMKSDAQAKDKNELQPLQVLSNANSDQGGDRMETNSISSVFPEMQGSAEQEKEVPSETDSSGETQYYEPRDGEDASPKLLFYLEGQQVDGTLSLYQAILRQQIKSEHEIVTGTKVWTRVHTISYGRALVSQNSCVSDKTCPYMQDTYFFPSILPRKIAFDMDKSGPTDDILFLLRSLEGMNRYTFHLTSHERIRDFAEGRIDNLDNLKVLVNSVPQNEFVSSKLTEKLEQQMRDSLAVAPGGLPSWCNQLMASFHFLFSFEAKCKYFRLAAFGPRQVSTHPLSHSNSGAMSDWQQSVVGLPRKKVLVCRDQILESAAQMMDLHAHNNVLLEVEYNEEVGTGLGPTLEFYTLVCEEFQKPVQGMWIEDHSFSTSMKSSQFKDSGIMMSSFGLFPRPWSSTSNSCDGIQYSEVLKKFLLLGQVVAKALQDRRVLDLPFSKAFYKLILGKELSLYDIQSFDPELGRALLEFQALVNRKKFLESADGENSMLELDLCYRNTRIEDLCLDFTLPGYPDYVLASGPDHKMVNLTNLDDYIALIVDATIHAGISKQVEAFRSGFDQVFPIKYLQVFSEEELERLLCGELNSFDFNELLDHIKFDHGYTASSPPIINLLEIIQEFEHEQRRAFLQFVTGAPRLPPGGLASLNPKLTIVRKHSSSCEDTDLPSVMTCANYLKLPPYSSKERMKEKLLYAIMEGQGSFHLS